MKRVLILVCILAVSFLCVCLSVNIESDIPIPLREVDFDPGLYFDYDWREKDLERLDRNMSQHSLPFVTPGAFEEIGRFDYARLAFPLSHDLKHHTGTVPKVSDYGYILRDENQCRIQIAVHRGDHDQDTWTQYPVVKDPALPISAVSSLGECVRYENMLFRYRDGQLRRIEWGNSGFTFAADFSPAEDTLSETETFFTRLLSSNVKEAADMIESLNIRQNTKYGLLTVLSWEGAVVLQLIAIPLVLLALFFAVKGICGMGKTEEEKRQALGNISIFQKLLLCGCAEDSIGHKRLLKCLRWLYRGYFVFPALIYLSMILFRVSNLYKLIFVYACAVKWVILDIPVILFCVFWILRSWKHTCHSGLGKRILAGLCAVAVLLLSTILAVKTDIPARDAYEETGKSPKEIPYWQQTEDPSTLNARFPYTAARYISYKAFEKLGEFDYAKFSLFNFERYEYHWIDDNQMHIQVNIQHLDNAERKAIQKSVYGVDFVYTDGRLSKAQWYVGNVILTMIFHKTKAPLENDTFYTRLLSATPSKAAAMIRSLPVRLFTVPQLSWKGAAALQPVFSILIPAAVYFTVRWLFGQGKTKEELQLALGSSSRSQKLSLDGYLENIPGNRKRLRVLRRIYWGYLMYPAGAYIFLLVSRFQPIYQTVFTYVCLAKLVILDVPILLFCGFILAWGGGGSFQTEKTQDLTES